MSTHTRFVITALLSLTACEGDQSPEPSAATAAEAPTPTSSAKQAPAAGGEAAALAGKPKQRVSIENLGLAIEVPEGTTVTPPRADMANRHANLEQGAFMVNVFAVDEFSTPDFAGAKEVYKTDKLVAWIRAEETATGWITFKEVVSGLHKARRFEVNVRTVVAGKKWDCSISAPSKELAELTLAACQTLTTIAAEPPVAVRAPAAGKPQRARATKVQGVLDKATIGSIVRRHYPRMRGCYERVVLKNPTFTDTVTTRFVIGGDGKVTSASASASDSALASCVGAVFRGLQFPAPADGKPVAASYPIRFTPSA